MKSKTKIYGAFTAATVLGVWGLKSCADTAQQESQEKTRTLLAAAPDQQFNAVKSSSAFIQCNEKLTHHFNTIPADASALSAMLQPGTGCVLRSGQSRFPDLPTWKAAVDSGGKLEYTPK